MAKTQRRPVPRHDSGEIDTALAFLTFARESVLKKTEDLADEQLRRALVPTGTSLLGLVQHLAASERYWLGHHVAGLVDGETIDFDMTVPTGVTTAQILTDYRSAAAESDKIIRTVGDPEAPVTHPVDGEYLNLRWVLAHLTSETARHAGHADIIREQLDGTTGR